MRRNSPESLHASGLFGDLSWNESDQQFSGASTVILMLASCAYFGAAWVMSGLAPLPLLASRIRSGRAEGHFDINTPSSSVPNWRNTSV